jgi:hypothetical protein
MHPITHPRSRRFMVAVAAALAALLMVAVSTAVTSAQSQTTPTTNANRAFSGFHDNPIKMPFVDEGTIATLKIPVAGSYVINAKLTAENKAPDGSTGRCVLSAGGDFDEVRFDLTNYFGGSKEVLALQLVHTFASPGSVTLKCLAIFGAHAEDIKITAVQAGNLTNTPI